MASSPEEKSIKATLLQTAVNYFTKMNKYWRGLLVFIALMIAAIHFSGDRIVNTTEGIFNAIYGRQTQEEINAQHLEMVRYVDSIKIAVQKKQTERSLVGRFEIQQECRRLQNIIPNCITVSFWSVHNGGAALKVDNNWELDVNESSDRELEIDFNENKDGEESEKIWDGLIYFAKRLREEKLVYLPDVTKDPLFYQGKLKTHVNVRGLKSTKAMYIGNDGKNLYYVSFDFSVVDPKKVYPYLRQDLRSFALFVKERIIL